MGEESQKKKRTTDDVLAAPLRICAEVPSHRHPYPADRFLKARGFGRFNVETDWRCALCLAHAQCLFP